MFPDYSFTPEPGAPDAAMRAEIERLQLALAASGVVGLWDWMISSDLLHGDANFARLYGLDPARTAAGLTMQAYQEFVVLEDVAALRDNIRATFERRADFLVEYRIAIPGQPLRWVECKGSLIDDAQGRPARFSGTAIDITRRKQIDAAAHALESERDRIAVELRSMNTTLEQRIAERTAERDRMWDTSPDLLWIVDVDGILRRVNPAWTRLLGYQPSELEGRPVHSFVVAENNEATAAGDAMAATDASQRIENRYRHKDGSTRWISWVAAPAGNMTYATGRDISEEKERAAMLADMQEALRQSQKMEAIGQLTGGLAHDFNNLLAGISGALELMQYRMQKGEFKDLGRYLQTAQGGVKRAAALTHRLLAFSRRQTLDPKPADVNRLIADMQELVQRTVGAGIALDVTTEAGLWHVLVDAPQLENALLNLCINARDAMPDGGRITILTANETFDDDGCRQHDLAAGEYISLQVTDTGCGIAADLLAKVFEPFFTTKPLGEGTGLGLSMVYGFARQSGGQVRVHSESGVGTTLCIYLPRHHGTLAADISAGQLAALPHAERSQTVLVVDDEPMIRMLLLETLTDLGYHALEAADSTAGLEILRSDLRIDLLVSDVGLPGGLNGRQMADAARVVRPDLKVLFITGYAETAAVGNGSPMQGMQVMTKPFEMEALALRIRAVVEA
ncbi:MAG: PAS domain S-box protein [Pseudomonadota bacterium]|nr:PAS domain S-box protein [Pseudomonadota bacterium]